jgi:hypothetical protein
MRLEQPPFNCWFLQALSDFECAEILYRNRARLAPCHAVAKYQQSVEKGVKALACWVMETYPAIELRIGFEHQVNRLISQIRSLSLKHDTQALVALKSFLESHQRSEIEALMSLAPKRPASGARPQRNTEYPFRDANDVWLSPCEPTAFSDNDLDRYRAIADVTLKKANEIFGLP